MDCEPCQFLQGEAGYFGKYPEWEPPPVRPPTPPPEFDPNADIEEQKAELAAAEGARRAQEFLDTILAKGKKIETVKPPEPWRMKYPKKGRDGAFNKFPKYSPEVEFPDIPEIKMGNALLKSWYTPKTFTIKAVMETDPWAPISISEKNKPVMQTSVLPVQKAPVKDGAPFATASVVENQYKTVARLPVSDPKPKFRMDLLDRTPVGI